jgi:hypothetical protein
MQNPNLGTAGEVIFTFHDYLQQVNLCLLRFVASYTRLLG